MSFLAGSWENENVSVFKNSMKEPEMFAESFS